MPTRFVTRVVPKSVMAAGIVAAAAVGQDVPGAPRFFPGVHGPGAGATETSHFNPTYRGPATGSVPKLTQPVIAGPSGVVPAGGFEAEPAQPAPGTKPALPTATPPTLTSPTLPPASGPASSLTIPTSAAAQVQPTVTVEAEKPVDASASSKPSGPQPFMPLPMMASPPSGPTLPPATAATPLPGPAKFPPAPEMEPKTAGTPLASGTPLATQPLPSRQSPDVTVEIVAPSSISVGRAFAYEIVVRNSGTNPVANVRVEDEVPTKAALVSTEPAAETAGGRLGWNLGTLDAGGERRLKVTVTPSEEGDLRSQATITFATGVETKMTVTRPRVTVAMSGPETVRVGEKVPFTITLTNSGSGPAAKVALRAQFAEGLTHPAGQVIEAELADLPAGQSKTVTLEATASRSGSAGCVLTCTADGNAAVTARTAVSLVEPLLAIKPTGPEKCLVNAQPTFTFELSNPGTAATDPVTLWAGIPDGFDFVEASEAGAFDPASKTAGWRLPALAAGGTKTVTLKLKAIGPADGNLRLLARAGAEPAAGVVTAGHRPEDNPKPLEARVDTPLKSEGVPALRFQVIDLEDPVIVGQDAIYEVRVMNQGTGPCTGIRLAVDLTEGSAAVGAEGPTTGRVSGTQIVFDPIAELAVKAEVVYKVRVRGNRAGDSRFRANISCDQLRTPVVKEESTSFVGQP